MKRKYLPTLAELIDRMSIVQMKQIFISENAEEYEKEIRNIMHDIDFLLINKEPNNELIFNAKCIRASLLIQFSNRIIWENESKARLGGSDQDKLLKFTHSINGIRNTAKNIISREIGERVDLKIDSLADNLPTEYGNWNIFTGWEQ
jgi:hypothetical protein